MLVNMKFIFRIFSLMLLMSIMLVGCGGSSNDNTTPLLGDVTIAFKLSSESTIPQVDESGSGTGSITLNRDSGLLSGSITVSGLTGAVTAAHIHSAIAGIAGGVIITLQQDTGNASLLNVPSGTTIDAMQSAALQNSEYYVNVHTAANASGEIRGQIIAVNQQVIRTLLKGENQVPIEVNSINMATAYVTVDTVSGDTRGNIRNVGLDDASAAHIHDGFAGTSGGVLHTLNQDAIDVALWSLADNTMLDATQLASLLAGGLYFNVHTPAHAAGEVRGQIIAQSIELERVSLIADFEVPPVISAGSAVGYLTVNEDSGAVTVNIITDSLADTTAAHIHAGIAGTNGGIILSLTKDITDSTLFKSADGDMLDAMALADFFEGKLYFNVHTSSNPAGDVRAQLTPRNLKVVRSILVGAQSVPSVITSASGIAYTTVNEDDGSINANVRTSGITATGAHIHGATFGNTGGIELSLTQDMTDTDFWMGNATLDANQLNAFFTDALYYNVHSSAFPGGEIRAQITR